VAQLVGYALGVIMTGFLTTRVVHRYVVVASRGYAFKVGLMLSAGAVGMTAFILHIWAIPPVLSPVLVITFGLWGALSVVDCATLRLPNALVAPAVLLPLICLPVVAMVQSNPVTAVRVVMAAAVSGAMYLCLHLVSPGGMGFGDVKFAPSIGAVMGWYSWDATLWAIAAAFLCAAAVALPLMAARRNPHHLPFGPFMVAGAVIAASATYLT
jgi:leader peptidase (prepilin peptidase) / N-methyltransferase